MVVEVAVKRRPAAGPAQCEDESCGLLLARLARAVNSSMAAALSRLGLRAQQFGVLHRLAEAGPASPSELASSLGVHASNLVRVLDELEAEGLIARGRDPEDRRRQIVVLTRPGVTVLRRAEDLAGESEAQLLAPLSQAERRRLQELLGRVASHACAGPGGCEA